jgi:hypothetical protein
LGGPLEDIGSNTGATGENCGVENVGRESRALRPSAALEFSLRVIAAIERMSMSPEPSVVDVEEGARIPAEWDGTASASRFDKEKSTEFSLRWAVRWALPAPFPGLLTTAGSAACAGEDPNKNGEEGAGDTGCATTPGVVVVGMVDGMVDDAKR